MTLQKYNLTARTTKIKSLSNLDFFLFVKEFLQKDPGSGSGSRTEIRIKIKSSIRIPNKTFRIHHTGYSILLMKAISFFLNTHTE